MCAFIQLFHKNSSANTWVTYPLAPLAHTFLISSLTFFLKVQVTLLLKPICFWVQHTLLCCVYNAYVIYHRVIVNGNHLSPTVHSSAWLSFKDTTLSRSTFGTCSEVWYVSVVLVWGQQSMRWTLCYVQMINSKQIAPIASIHVNGMNCNAYHFQMSPFKHFTYLPSLGWQQLLKMFGDPSFMEQALGHMQAYQRILLWNMQWVRLYS